MDHHVLGEKVLSVADDICLISSAYDYPNHNYSSMCIQTHRWLKNSLLCSLVAIAVFLNFS